jgi:hypothetical protein
MRYNAGDSAQVATTTGVNIAALNGATATNPTWSSSTNTTSASDVTVAKVSGVRTSTNTAMRAVVTASLPLAIGQLFTTRTAVTVSATAYAELLAGASGGGQPCAVALKTSGTGITVQGGAAVSAAGCTLRSNSGVAVTNGSGITASWVYGTSATVSGNSFITNGTTTVNPNNVSGWNNSAPLDVTSTTISDPFASNTAIQNAFKSLSPGSGTAFNGTWQPSTLSPGTFASITSGSGNITLNPGLYIVNGNISIGNGAALTGNGVTLVTSGTITFGGGSAVTLSAPVSGATSGVPGIVIAGNSTGTDTLSNGMKPTLNGAVYFPNGTLAIAGGVQTGNNCLELVAGTLSISNGATFASTNCSAYGTPTFGSINSSTVALVQ